MQNVSKPHSVKSSIYPQIPELQPLPADHTLMQKNDKHKLLRSNQLPDVWQTGNMHLAISNAKPEKIILRNTFTWKLRAMNSSADLSLGIQIPVFCLKRFPSLFPSQSKSTVLKIHFIAASASNAMLTTSTFLKYKILTKYNLRLAVGAIFPDEPEFLKKSKPVGKDKWISQEFETS